VKLTEQHIYPSQLVLSMYRNNVQHKPAVIFKKIAAYFSTEWDHRHTQYSQYDNQNRCYHKLL